jgi:catechol 2,3-dioxygenase-like lactoylglutathione lyase family enzyme
MRLCSARAGPLADFYESALGFRRVAMEHLSGAWAQQHLAASGRVMRVTLALGAQRVTMLQFIDRPGRLYPVDAKASDLVFQHFAIVVDDMAAAMAQLARTAGWTAITADGPQQLPVSSGGVTAFKFRDPEGHPLELLAFPPDDVPARWRHVQGNGPFLGIDHSAISVADSVRSAAFYESLGLTVSNRSINDDPAQARLDDLDDPRVEVTAMAPAVETPHVELLAYRSARRYAAPDLAPNDVAATCLVFEVEQGAAESRANPACPMHLVDPDGHRLSIVLPSG